MSSVECTRFPSATGTNAEPTTTGTAGRLTTELGRSFLLFGGGSLTFADPEEGVEENMLDDAELCAIDHPVAI